MQNAQSRKKLRNRISCEIRKFDAKKRRVANAGKLPILKSYQAMRFPEEIVLFYKSVLIRCLFQFGPLSLKL